MVSVSPTWARTCFSCDFATVCAACQPTMLPSAVLSPRNGYCPPPNFDVSSFISKTVPDSWSPECSGFQIVSMSSSSTVGISNLLARTQGAGAATTDGFGGFYGESLAEQAAEPAAGESALRRADDNRLGREVGESIVDVVPSDRCACHELGSEPAGRD